MLLPVLPALNIFASVFTAYDVTVAEDADRRFTETRGADYQVGGSFQPLSERDLQLLPEGDILDGAQVFVTTATLHIRTTGALAGVQNVQSYIQGDGELWRVKALDVWRRQGGFNRYVCVKSLNLRSDR